MIAIDRNSIPIPEYLNTPERGGQFERKRAEEFFALPENKEKKMHPEFKAYKNKKVAKALVDLFNGKCAYCESTYMVASPTDIEHYRPKSAVMVDGKLKRPGYYWLAADWENLLPSCIDCNRIRQHNIVGIGPLKLGKGNRFPLDMNLEDRKDLELSPGVEQEEKRLLLDPCRDNPEDHLEFFEDGTVRAKKKNGGQQSKIGRASIEVYALLRKPLVDERRSRALQVLDQIATANFLLKKFDSEKDDEVLEHLKRVVAELKRQIADDRPYLALTRKLVKERLPIQNL